MPAARPKSRTTSPLPAGVLTGAPPRTLLQDGPEAAVASLLRGDLREGGSLPDIVEIPPLVLYTALRDGLAPASLLVEGVLVRMDAALVMLTSFLPHADAPSREKLLARILKRMADASVKDNGVDMALALTSLWPQLEDEAQKQRFLAGLVKFLKRKARSTCRDDGAALLSVLATLEPAWYPGLVELALQIPSRPDLVTMMREGDAELADHLCGRPEFGTAIRHQDMWVLATQKYYHDPDSALRILDAFPDGAVDLLNNVDSYASRPCGRTQPGDAEPLLHAWLDSRDPEMICANLPAALLAGKHPGMREDLRRVVLRHVCGQSDDAFRALGVPDFFEQLAPEQAQSLIDATAETRKRLAMECLHFSPDAGRTSSKRGSSTMVLYIRYSNIPAQMQTLADRYSDLPVEHPSRRVLAVDLVANLLLLESVEPDAFMELDRGLAHRANLPVEGLLESLLQTWAGSSANEVKTVWRAMAPQDAETATGLIDGLLAITPEVHTAPETEQASI